MLCQIPTFFRAGNSNAMPFLAFSSQSRLLTFHFDGTADTGGATGAAAAGEVVAGAVAADAVAGAAFAAGFGAAGFGAAGLRAAAGALTGTAGADDRNIANVSEPPATTRSAASAMCRFELPARARVGGGGGIAGGATWSANSGAETNGNSVIDEAAGAAIGASNALSVATAGGAIAAASGSGDRGRLLVQRSGLLRLSTGAAAAPAIGRLLR